MRNVQWVVQSNLNQQDVLRIENACRENNVMFTPIYVIPFSTELPDFDKSIPAIYYGSTTMGHLVRGEKGFFMNDNFTVKVLSENYGDLLLNYAGHVYVIEYLMQLMSLWEPDYHFIRPIDDSKSFAGQLIHTYEIQDWFAKLQQSDSTELTMSSEVLVARPRKIETEWRLWIVLGKVIAASQYRRNDILIKKEGCPTGVKDFAELVCRLWTPHDVFCMDVCVLPEVDEPRIVECGCFNSCGFYAADVNEIVKQVTNYYESMAV